MADFFRGYTSRHKRDSEELVRVFRYSHGPAGGMRGQALLESHGEFRPTTPPGSTCRCSAPPCAAARGGGPLALALGRVAEVCPAPACHVDFPIFGPAEAFVAGLPRPGVQIAASGCSASACSTPTS